MQSGFPKIHSWKLEFAVFSVCIEHSVVHENSHMLLAAGAIPSWLSSTSLLLQHGMTLDALLPLLGSSADWGQVVGTETERRRMAEGLP